MIVYRSTPLPIRKRSFQLFEILISMALISLCLFPLVKPLAAMRHEDRNYLETIQLEAAAQNAFCRVKEKLYEYQTYTWKQLSSKISGEFSESFNICTSPDGLCTYRCSYILDKPYKDANKTTLHTIGRVITITLNFQKTHSTQEPISFHRTLFIEKET